MSLLGLARNGRVGLLLIASPKRPLAVTDALEHSFERVVILRGDWIELVIVATRAVDRHAEKCLPNDANHIFEILFANAPLHHLALLAGADFIPRTCDEKARRDDSIRRARRQDIACNLLARELIVGLVRIEALDHVIAVTPRVGTKLVALESLAFTEARDVEPMPRPTLPISRISQQLLDQDCDRNVVISRVIDKLGDGLRGWRQAVEIER